MYISNVITIQNSKNWYFAAFAVSVSERMEKLN